MSLSTLPVRLAQISDIHCGELTFDRKLMQTIVDRVNAMELDAVVVAGDLTASGY